ncbi:MAG: methyltransferase domain-containing protein [Acidimicrobiia bacterium]|nr:methyltransferase domain-containing protein [Acidimicrobiia bacterium]
MSTDAPIPAAAEHWHRPGLTERILEALAAAGKDVDNLTVDDLAASDQFHGGGRPATLALAALAGLDQPTDRTRRVLDVGGGLGGPARTLASRFGCAVTAVDLTESYVAAARELTDRVGLADRVAHLVGDALRLDDPALGLEPGSFDVVWTQNAGMNIADKEALYAGFHRMLRPGGTLTFQEPTTGANSPPHYPLMWADDPSLSFLRSPAELRALVAAAGFEERAWELVTESATGANAPPAPPHAIQRLIMGDHLAAVQAAGRRNLDEDRISMVHAAFTRR